MNTAKIKELCAQNHITVAELERNLGIGNGTIGRWENSYPRANNLKAVADYFNVSMENLMGEVTA